MKNDYLDTQITLYENHQELIERATYKGEITFMPKMNLNVLSLGYQFIMEGRGKLYPLNKSNKKVEFLRNRKLIKDKTYRYEIDFTTSSPFSYQGQNVSITWKLETIVKLRSDSYLKIRNDYLKKRGLRYHNDTSNLLLTKLELTVVESRLPYTVQSQTQKLEPSIFLPFAIFAGGSFATAFIVLKNKMKNNLEILGTVVGLLFCVFILPTLYKVYLLAKMKVDTKPLGGNQFIVVLDLTKNWKDIQKVKVNYSIHEEVTDKRGTSPTVHKSKFYQSPDIEKNRLPKNSPQVLDFPEITYDFVFDFPKGNFPTTLIIEDLKFYWQINITVFFNFGLKSKFTKKIYVSREEITSDTDSQKDIT